MANLYFLRNGDSFIINPETELNPAQARTLKKQYLLTLNTQDLTTDKMWTAEAVRNLATGLIQVKGEDGKSRASKPVLVERLTKLVAEERAVLLLTQETLVNTAENTLQDCDFSPVALKDALGMYSGNDLVDAVVGMILRKGYQPSTIVKTIVPDVVKVIRTTYGKEDCEGVIHGIHARLQSTRKLVNQHTNDGVAVKCNDRTATNWQPLYEGISEIFERVETATWKELSLALAFATGRRCAEVHGVATKFTYIDDEHISFEGQLKTRDLRDVGSYIIPVLYDAKTVIRARERLVELGRGLMTPDEVTRKLSKALSTELPPNLVALKKASNITQYKDLRDTYAAKVSESKPSDMSQNAYLSKIMGHGEKDLQTASTYDKRYIAYT